MSKRQERINIINLLYRYFILQYNILIKKQKNNSFYKITKINTEIIKIKKILINLSDIIIKINKYLKPGWKFNRLSNYHKSVLIYGVYEIYYKKLSKAIVINESLEILKLYSEDTNFSYINSILDKI